MLCCYSFNQENQRATLFGRHNAHAVVNDHAVLAPSGHANRTCIPPPYTPRLRQCLSYQPHFQHALINLLFVSVTALLLSYIPEE